MRERTFRYGHTETSFCAPKTSEIMRAVLLSAARGGLRCSARRLVVHAPAARHCSTKAPRSVSGTAGSNSTQQQQQQRRSTATGGDSFWHNPTLRRNVSVLVGSQVMLNIGVSQVVPVLPTSHGDGLGAAGIGTLMASPFARLTCNLPRPAGGHMGTKAADAVWDAGYRRRVRRHRPLYAQRSPPCAASRLLVGAGSASSMAGSTAMMQDNGYRAAASCATDGCAVLFALRHMGRGATLRRRSRRGVRRATPLWRALAWRCSFGYARLPETLRARRAPQ